MEPAAYLLKVNVAIALFCLIYRLFYRKDTFFSVRRYVLQTMLFLSALYPFMDFSHWMMHHTTITDMAMSYRQILPEAVGYAAATENVGVVTQTKAPVLILPRLLWVYLAVTLLLLLRMVFRVGQIVWLRFHSQSICLEGKRVFKLNTETNPFSFFSWIFINPALYDANERHEILTHEMVHLRQYHSLDILVAEFMTAVCWLNPMVWMLQKEIQKNLEFLVDSVVVNEPDIDRKSYQYHLLKLTCHTPGKTIANSFNISPLKERIRMINLKKSPKVRLVAYTLILPLLLLFLGVNNVGAVAERISQNEKMKNVMAKVTEVMSELTWEKVVSESSLMIVEKPSVQPETEKRQRITGVVKTKDEGEPLVGVNVIVCEDYMVGTVTDANGRFQLMVREGDVLCFSHIGYTEKKFVTKDQSTDIGVLEMSPKSEMLNEIVVMAFDSSQNEEIPQQEDDSSMSDPNENGVDSANVDLVNAVFITVEKMPEFPGGEEGLKKYIGENLNYPVRAMERGLEGQVHCRFTIRENGSVGNVTVDQSVDPLLDDEAIRVIYSMPLWIPGEQRGKKVAVEYTVPVTFRIVQTSPEVQIDTP